MPYPILVQGVRLTGAHVNYGRTDASWQSVAHFEITQVDRRWTVKVKIEAATWLLFQDAVKQVALNLAATYSVPALGF